MGEGIPGERVGGLWRGCGPGGGCGGVGVGGGTQEELNGDVADVEGGVPQGASQFEEVSGGPEDIGRWGEVRR